MESNRGLNDIEKPNARRRSDFVLGRRKSVCRSSHKRAAYATEELSAEDRLKHFVLESVKEAARKVSEDLKLQGEEKYLNVQVEVEECCGSIEEDLRASGFLESACLQNGVLQETDHLDHEIACVKAYTESLLEEGRNWDAALAKERQRLESTQMAKDNILTMVPYEQEGKPDYEGLLASVAEQSQQLSFDLRSIKQSVDYYSGCHQQAQGYLLEREHEIREEFEDSIEGDIKDIIKRLIFDKYE